MEIVKIDKNAKVLALISRDTGTEPRLDQYSHERQRGKAPEERARRRLGHKYVNTFRRGSRVSKHFASGILNYDTASEFRLETTMTYLFGTLSQPLHHVNANQCDKNCSVLEAVRQNQRGLGEERLTVYGKKRGMPGDHCWASQPQTMANTQGIDC